MLPDMVLSLLLSLLSLSKIRWDEAPWLEMFVELQKKGRLLVNGCVVCCILFYTPCLSRPRMVVFFYIVPGPAYQLFRKCPLGRDDEWRFCFSKQQETFQWLFRFSCAPLRGADYTLIGVSLPISSCPSFRKLKCMPTYGSVLSSSKPDYAYHMILSRSLFSKISTLGEVWIETFAPELKKTKPSSYASVLPHLLLKFINFSKIYAMLTI
jgi:hypothetical protein